MHEFGKSLYSLRKKKKLSQEELARDVNSTKSTISKYERQVIDPTLDIAKRIADRLGVSVEYMVNPTPKKNNTLEIDDDYIEAIKIAKNNNISPNKLIELIDFTIRMRNERE